MDTLVLHSSSTAQWQALVSEAQDLTHIKLGEDMESYLVFLLMRFSNHPEIVRSLLAIDFLQSLKFAGRERAENLRDLGDKCLLFAGLFPGNARRRRVRISYFIELGQTAYSSLALDTATLSLSALYTELGQHFVGLMDVLHSMHEVQNRSSFLDLLQAQELWSDTKSPHALKTLQNASTGFFMKDPSSDTMGKH